LNSFFSDELGAMRDELKFLDHFGGFKKGFNFVE